MVWESREWRRESEKKREVSVFLIEEELGMEKKEKKEKKRNRGRMK